MDRSPRKIKSVYFVSLFIDLNVVTYIKTVKKEFCNVSQWLSKQISLYFFLGSMRE